MPQASAADTAHVRLTTQTSHELNLQNGINAYQSKDYSIAIKIFEPLASNGNAIAQGYLGRMYYEGLGTPMDYEQAIKWFGKAAENRNAFAQFKLGVMYRQGQGTPKDYKLAALWFRKAIEQGYESALIQLGYLYYKGYGVHKDYVVAYALCNPTFTTNITDFNTAATIHSSIIYFMTSAQIAAGHELTHEMQHYGIMKAFDAYLDSRVQ